MITRVAFVAHPVRDMGAARRFYGEVLGLAPGADFQGVWSEFTTPDGQTVALDTFSPKYSETPTPYLALETDDIDGEVARLRAAGARIGMEPWLNQDDQGRDVCRMAFVLDPDGNAIMLHQTAPARLGADRPA
ncbi:MAG: VOC family protein [Nitrospirae bacterium]|nr:VOC family protein [Nitrospirota bacterium]